jgi:PST family polysaccharide transporter
VVLNFVQTALLWLMTSWRPGLGVSRRHFADVFHFSRHSLGNTLLQFANNRSDDFLIGVFLGPSSLGLYTVAYRLLSTLNDVINQMLLGVAFPVFSRIQDDRARLGRAYGTVLKVGAALAFPGYLFFVVGAPEVVEVFFGPRWAPAAPVMAVLAVFGALQTSIVITDSCLNAMGRPQIVFRNRAISTVAQVAAFVVAAPYGIIWVAWALVARAYLLAPLPVWSLIRAGVIDLRTWFSSFVGPLFATAAMLLVTGGVRWALLPHTNAVGRLAVMLAVAAVVYVVALAVLDRATFREVVGMMAHRKRRLPAGAHRKSPTRVPLPGKKPAPDAVAADG